MDMFSAIIGGAGGVVSLANNLYNFGLERDRYNNMVSQQILQNSKQDMAWMREDTAMQRRVLDLRQAGLSPTLAAGTPAQTTAPVTTVPSGGSGGSNAMELIQLASVFSNIERNKAEVLKLMSDKQATDLLSEERSLDNTYTRHLGFNPKYASNPGKMLNEIEKVITKIGTKLSETVPRMKFDPNNPFVKKLMPNDTNNMKFKYIYKE